MYQDKLKDLPVLMNPEPEGCTNGYWMPTFVVEGDTKFDREEMCDQLKGVDARVFFWPLSSTPVGGRKAFVNPYLSESIHFRALNLPSYCELSGVDVSYVCGIIKDILVSTQL